jgi:uncharacterized protein YfkK (UPF0435 family)
MADQKDLEKKKGELGVLVGLELTCMVLWESFSLVYQDKKKYTAGLKKKIDKELRYFNKSLFIKGAPSQDLTVIGKYCTALIGRDLFKEKQEKEMIEIGTKYVMNNLSLLKDCDDYSNLSTENLQKLYRFFRSLTSVAMDEANKITFPKPFPKPEDSI